MRIAVPFVHCVLASLLVIGCDTDFEPAPPIDPPPAMMVEDVEAFREIVQQVDIAVRDYETAMAELAAPAGCLAVHDAYDREVRPLVTRMLGTSDELDELIHAHGGVADLHCGSRALMFALDDHNHIACMWPTVDEDREEATQHINMMLTYTTHMTERCDEMALGMTGGGWEWSTVLCAY